jgi:hypothetical protein
MGVLVTPERRYSIHHTAHYILVLPLILSTAGFPSVAHNRAGNTCEEGCNNAVADCGYNGPGTNGTRWLQKANDDLGWLWGRVGVLLPDLYASGWVQGEWAPSAVTVVVEVSGLQAQSL